MLQDEEFVNYSPMLYSKKGEPVMSEESVLRVNLSKDMSRKDHPDCLQDKEGFCKEQSSRFKSEET